MAEHPTVQYTDPSTAPLSERLQAWDRAGRPGALHEDQTVQAFVAQAAALEAPTDGARAVLRAAQDYIDNQAAPDSPRRATALRDAVAALSAVDPVSAVIVAAAAWLDASGMLTSTPGAGRSLDRRMDLQDAVDDALRAGH